MWALHNGQWIEVFRDPHGGVYAVDARITRHQIFSPVYDEKPDPVDEVRRVGEKIVVRTERVIQVTECETRSSFEPDALWGEIDSEFLHAEVASVKVIRAEGFEHTHRCGYCQEFAATDPGEAFCVGCGQQAWEEWPDEAPAIGMQPKPAWAK